MEQNDYPGALALLKEGNETLSRDYGTFSESIDALLPVCYDRYEAFLLTEAKNLADLEDYEAAAAKIRNAAGDFPTEREALTAALTGYEDDARQKRLRSAGARADDAYAAGSYVEAFEILEKFMTLPDEDVEGTKELLAALEQRFVEDNCSHAEEVFDGRRENLEEAIAILDWALDQRELEEISAYRDHLMEYLPLNLTEAEFAGKEGVVFRNTGDFEALNGKTYSDGWVWGADGAELTFRPDGAYDLLECKFVTRRDDEVEATGWFEVWCDGECVFTSEKLVHPQVDGQSVEVDITGCDELKLVFRCDYEVSTAESGYCYHGMCNPTLTKNIEETMTEGE
jgi:tetratricopeptide (TPR) repeat protein